MIDKKRMYDNMLRMIAVPSISGTDDEKYAADKIEELLYEIPYFAEHRRPSESYSYSAKSPFE